MKKLSLHHLSLYCFNLLNAASKWQEDFQFGRYVKEVPFVSGRYTKGQSFLPKMVYKRDRTTWWGLPIVSYTLLFWYLPHHLLWTVCLPYAYLLLFGKSATNLTTLLVANFNWETLEKLENSKGWRKQFCTNALLSCDVKYRKWEQIASSQLPAKVLSP